MIATAIQESDPPPRPTLRLVRGDGLATDAIRVLVVHDSPIVRAGIGAFLDLERDLEVVGAAADTEHAVELVRRLRPHVVLLSVCGDELDGAGATRRMLQEHSLAVMVLAASEHDGRAFGVLRAGAAGVVLADREPAELIRAVRLAARGDRRRRAPRRRGGARVVKAPVVEQEPA
jgi:DNA-binding NarL/FixJ family response regulator